MVTLTTHLLLWPVGVDAKPVATKKSSNWLAYINHVPGKLVFLQVGVLHVNTHPSHLHAATVLAGLLNLLLQTQTAIFVGLGIRSHTVSE